MLFVQGRNVNIVEKARDIVNAVEHGYVPVFETAKATDRRVQQYRFLRSLGLTPIEIAYYKHLSVNDETLLAAIIRRAILVCEGVVTEEDLRHCNYYALSRLEKEQKLSEASLEELKERFEKNIKAKG